MNVALLSEKEKEQYKKVVCEELWLKYFNSSLRKQRVITEKEFLRMNTLILERTQRLLNGIKEGICYEKSGTNQHSRSLPDNRRRMA